MIQKTETTKLGAINLIFEERNTSTIFKYNMFFSFNNTNFKVKVESIDNYKEALKTCIEMYISSEEDKEETIQIEAHKNKFIEEYKSLNLSSLKALRTEAYKYMFDENKAKSTQYFYTGMYQAADRLIRQF
jgi:hypothetical protein